jgi:hypothetical protein
MSILAAVVLLVASNSNAQIYKWVDENGRTHYSANKNEAGKAKTDTVKTEPEPNPPRDSASSSAEYWKEQERKFRQRQITTRGAVPPRMTPMPRSLSGGRENGTDASRCALARDVLSGSVQHRNGTPTDKYDRDVAEDNVRRFCN